ncbi:hypothetical protein [Algisphaera agarilytica]|uniref:Uncharacterized protein n=1 Tax=Algisphaera agarilytica TaxID=1385975 RepID=A0A7X0H4N3_9BACT|nr:hypothetical protein [Algisphaera agarilytica]MBB6429222.1 hypothetical protein [Algisphaera agarilytica]
MPDIEEKQIMKPRNLTMGGDVHKGVTNISFRLNKKNLYPVFKEDDLTPSAYEQVRSNQPAVTVRITTMSREALEGLVDLVGDMTVEGKEPGTSNKTVFTFTSAQFLGGEGSIQNERAGEFTLEAQAIGYSTAPKA